MLRRIVTGLAAGGLGLLATAASLPGGPVEDVSSAARTPADSAWAWLGTTDSTTFRAAVERYRDWARTASLDDFCNLVNLQLDGKLKQAAGDSDSFETGLLTSLHALALLRDVPCVLSDHSRVLPDLAARLEASPEDLGAFLLFAGSVRSEGRGARGIAAETFDSCLVRMRGVIPVSSESHERQLVRLSAIERLAGEANRLGARSAAWRQTWMSALLAILRDESREPEVRGGALAAIGSLDEAAAREDVRRILASPEIPSDEPLRRIAIEAWASLEGANALPLLRTIVTTTSNEFVYATAVNRLLLVGGEEGLRIVIDERRDEWKSAGAFGLSQADTTLLNWLGGADPDDFRRALRSIRSIRPPSHPPAPPHPLRDTRAALSGFLADEAHRPYRKEILQVLLEELTPDEAKALLPKVPYSGDYDDEWRRLEKRARMRKAESRQGTVVPPERRGRNAIAEHELGDVGFKRIGFVQEWPILGDFGHCGIATGMKQNEYDDYVTRIIEVDTPIGGDVVHENDWSPMDCAEPACWGAFQPANSTLTFPGRKDVVELAERLISENISYAIDLNLDLIDALNVEGLPGLKIDPNEISRIRCDGLVEYCYESLGIPVWGPNGGNWDISNPLHLAAHNDLYIPLLGNPDTELAPVVQCGRAGGSSSMLTRPATGNAPSVSLYWVSTPIAPSLYSVDLELLASDRSGVHYIAYSTNGGASFKESPRQTGIPSSEELLFEDDIHLSASQYLHVYAMDTCGNVPEFAASVFLDVTRDNPAASVSALSLDGAAASWVVESEYATSGYILEGAADVAGPWTELARVTPGAGLRETALAAPGTPLVRLVEEDISGGRRIHSVASRAASPPSRSRVAAPPLSVEALRERLRDMRRHARAAHPAPLRPRGSSPSRELLIITVDEFVADVEEFVAAFWEGRTGGQVDVVSLGARTDPDAAGRRSFVRSVISLYALSLATKNVLLVGDANDWQEFVGPFASQYWAGPWEPLRDEMIASGFPAQGQPEMNLIPTFAVADPEPPGENMAYVVPYVLSDAPYEEGLDVVVGRWPCGDVAEVLAMALKMQTHNLGLAPPSGAASALAYIGDIDFTGTGDGWRAREFGESFLARGAPALEPHAFYRSEWSLPYWLTGQAAYAWNTLPGLRLVAIVGSLSTRYRPADVLNKEWWAAPFDVHSFLDTPRTPLVLGASCGTADFARTERILGQPLSSSPIAEDFLFTPQEGALAWVGPTCGTWQVGNEIIATTFLDELLADPERPIAASWKRARERIALEQPPGHPVHETLAAYVFLGDPLSPFEPPPSVVASPTLSPALPDEFALHAPRPNPSQGAVVLAVDVPTSARVDVAVYDVNGRRVCTLLAQGLSAGRHDVEWPGLDGEGRTVAPGIYFARAIHRGRAVTRKLVRTR